MQYLQILIGFIGLIALAIPFSNNIKLINYKHLAAGILFQIFLALLLLKAPLITSFYILGRWCRGFEGGYKRGYHFHVRLPWRSC